MKQKGQVFSVDFLISIMVIVLAIGLLLNFYELSAHAQKESKINSELRSAAERAADLLVYSPDVTCELWDTGSPAQRIMYIPNCLVKANNGKELTKAKLGLGGFNCEVSGTGEISAVNNPSDTGCRGNSTGVTEIIVVKRMVYVTNNEAAGNERILKQEYNDCIKNGCTASSGVIRGPYEITLKVWR